LDSVAGAFSKLNIDAEQFFMNRADELTYLTFK